MIILKRILCLLFLFSFMFINVYAKNYTISVCTTISLENALVCKKRIFENMNGKVFIVKAKDERFYTYLDIFDDIKKGKEIIKNASLYVKQQKPYIKEIDQSITALYSKEKTFIDLNDISKKSRIEKIYLLKNEIKEEIENNNTHKEDLELIALNPEIKELKIISSYPFSEGQKLGDEPLENFNEVNENELKKIEELKQISMDEFDKADDEKKIVEVVMNNKDEPTILTYEELIIEVDPITNIMSVNAKINNELKQISQYVVSTAKKDIKRPFGEGKISKISLNPIWYPTQDTLKSFQKRGINLPSVVPPGHKYNYMGAAKINLTHIVDGKNTFRIHGTLSEKTIGTNETAGCIRMKNSDVLQLAELINNFSQLKSLNKVKVILK